MYEQRKGKNIPPDKSNYILPNDMENRYGVLETKMSDLYRMIIPILNNVANKNACIFTSSQKELLRKFWISMILRSPYYDSSWDDEQVCKELSVFKDVMDMIFPHQNNSLLLQNIVAQNVCRWDYEEDIYTITDKKSIGGALYEEINSEFSKCYLYILKSNNQFVTSDMPFCITDIFMYFPMTPNYACLYLPYHDCISMKPNHILEISEEKGKAINDLMASQNSKYLYSNQKSILIPYIRNKCG